MTRRKISAGTRSDLGRDSRDAFLGLMKTCAKQGISFWDYLGSRLGVPGTGRTPLGWTYPATHSSMTARPFAPVTP
jgi:hypothetical protein